MRQFLLVSMLLAGAGCHGLHHRDCRSDCSKPEPCEKKVTSEKPKTQVVNAPVSEPAPRAAIAQEVMLVPTMVYRPFVAANPTQPVRLSSNMTVAQPQEPVTTPKEPVTTPKESVGSCKQEETMKKMVDACDKLQERIIYLEKCLNERTKNPPPPVCPQPLFRRPLFNRCESLFNRCEPQCEVLVPCDQPTMPPVKTMPTASTPVPSTSVTPLPQMPRRAPMVNID